MARQVLTGTSCPSRKAIPLSSSPTGSDWSKEGIYFKAFVIMREERNLDFWRSFFFLEGFWVIFVLLEFRAPEECFGENWRETLPNRNLFFSSKRLWSSQEVLQWEGARMIDGNALHGEPRGVAGGASAGWLGRPCECWWACWLATSISSAVCSTSLNSSDPTGCRWSRGKPSNQAADKAEAPPNQRLLPAFHWF